ncbi:MAG: tRNA lysidine(34) synthetase TilS [Bacteroidota bacterium]
MKYRLIKFLEENALLQSGERIMLAVSGGIDSVVMTHLFKDAEIPFSIAHCNFQLRTQESHDDAAFVENLAKTMDVLFFCKSFQTQEFAKNNKLSLQMAAREIRYQWFEEIRNRESYDFVATGHHLDDQIETFFINLLRGTGISGLRGFPVRLDNIIRPLLFLTRKEIQSYALDKGIRFREDSSNTSLYYGRNQIRHQLIPILEKIQPNFSHIMEGNFRNLKEAEDILLATALVKKEDLLQENNGTFFIDLAQLKTLSPIRTYLHYCLSDFNVNSSTLDGILKSLAYNESRLFYTDQFVLTKDRNHLIIEKKEAQLTDRNNSLFPIILPSDLLRDHSEKTISWDISEPLSLQLSVMTITHDFLIQKKGNIAQIDFDKLKEPLILRKWKNGDQFKPLGLKGKKKISDYFIDQKYTAAMKKEAWLLCSGEKVVWLVGERLDDNFKISSSTKRILTIDFSV